MRPPVFTGPMSPGSSRGSFIAERLAEVRRQVARAAETAGRDPEVVRIVAVTKGFGVEVVADAREAGLDMFGESRVQEALPKIAAQPDAEWHLVGHLQANKVRRAAGAFTVLHGVDSLDLLARIETAGHELGVRPRVLLQVNLAQAPNQHGFDAAWFADQVASAGDLVRALRKPRTAPVMGLMAIGPVGAGDEAARRCFGELRRLRDAIQQTSGMALPELSMGMSDDYPAAVAEGATLIRVGTALLGPRPDALSRTGRAEAAR